tara:strand:- start:768 stop:914 length:147 start_codon:yes stop_codon:yes gene_type:complete
MRSQKLQQHQIYLKCNETKQIIYFLITNYSTNKKPTNMGLDIGICLFN